MTRAALIAKLRDYDWHGTQHRDRPGEVLHEYLSWEECRRIIQDLEFCDFAHKALEGGELPQTLKKQAG